MPRHRFAARHAARPLLALAGVALTGTLAACSTPMDMLQHVHSESFSDVADARQGWVGVPAPGWLPADAGTIRSTATDDETNAVIAVAGGTAPEGCEEGPRVSLPFDGRYGGIETEAGLPSTVLRCGPYEVVETEDGWIGWFSASEPGETPEG